MAKVILVDNGTRDYVDSQVIASNLTLEQAKKKAHEYNKKQGPKAKLFAKAMPDDWEKYSYIPWP